MRATTAKPLQFIFLHLFSNGLNKEGNVITSVLSPTDPFKTPLGSYSTNPIHVVGIKQLSKSVRTLRAMFWAILSLWTTVNYEDRRMFNYIEPLRHKIVFFKLKHKTTFKIRTYTKSYVKPFCHCELLEFINVNLHRTVTE